MARAQNLDFGAFLCGSQNFKASNLLVFARRPAFFHFGSVELRVRTLKENNFLTRDILFEMKLSLSSAASTMLHEANFK